MSCVLSKLLDENREILMGTLIYVALYLSKDYVWV